MFYSRLAALVLLSTTFAGAWPIFPPRIYANHAAFGTANVAPGSFVSIQAEFAGQFPSDLTQVQISLQTSDGGVYALPAVEPPKEFPNKAYAVWAVIPQGATLGAATVTVSGIPLNATLQIVPTAPGLFTRNYLGYGTTIALDRSGMRLGLTNAALPLQEISLWGTGLGDATTSAVTVEIGGLPAQVVYAGAQGFPGLDQIDVIVPRSAPQSCYVPVRIRVKGVESNAGYIPISDTPSQCSHPLDLTYTDREALDLGNTILVARLPIRGRYNPTFADEYAALAFSNMNASDVFRATVTQGADVNTCVAVGASDDENYVVEGSIPLTGTLTGPDGRQMTLDYTNTVTPDPKPFFDRGTWNFASLPSSTFVAVQKDFYVPAPLREFSPGIFITFTSGQDMVFTWDPSRFTKDETISVQVGVGNLAPECRVFADQGSLVFPSVLFQKHKGYGIGVQLVVRPVKRESFTIYTSDAARIPVAIDPSFAAPLQGYVQ
jgi:uncharacterized protein (TIGR03437 family)